MENEKLKTKHTTEKHQQLKGRTQNNLNFALSGGGGIKGANFPVKFKLRTKKQQEKQQKN